MLCGGIRFLGAGRTGKRAESPRKTAEQVCWMTEDSW